MEDDIINKRHHLLAKDSTDDTGSTLDDTTDTSSVSDDDSDDEVLYKMIDGERVPCTPEETAAIKAQWAQAAIEAQQRQQINDLMAQDMSTPDKIQCLMSAINALAQEQAIPSDLATKISDSCQIYNQIQELNNQNQ
jgi:hypothetical protein